MKIPSPFELLKFPDVIKVDIKLSWGWEDSKSSHKGEPRRANAKNFEWPQKQNLHLQELTIKRQEWPVFTRKKNKTRTRYSQHEQTAKTLPKNAWRHIKTSHPSFTVERTFDRDTWKQCMFQDVQFKLPVPQNSVISWYRQLIERKHDFKESQHWVRQVLSKFLLDLISSEFWEKEFLGTAVEEA